VHFSDGHESFVSFDRLFDDGRVSAASRSGSSEAYVLQRGSFEREALVNVRPSILCPIDYSEASAGALQYAAAIAEHFVARLIVLTVEDPLLTAAMDLGTGVHWTRETSQREIARFVTDTFGHEGATAAMCEYDVAVGKPPVEILRVARERSCDLIVMSSHGLTGAHNRASLARNHDTRTCHAARKSRSDPR
jgi:universal stress protein A